MLLAWPAGGEELAVFKGRLEGLAELTCLKSRAELLREIRDAEVVVSSRLPDEAILAAEKLRFIQAVSAGVDSFNFELLRERGIMLASAKGCNARAVAEHALALLLALAKRVTYLDREVKAGRWVPWTGETYLEDLEGKTVGIIGYGRIGRELARMCKCLGMRVMAVKRRPPEEGRDEYADFVGGPGDLERVLSSSDYVVVALPLTPETEGLIGEDELRAMKRSAYLINVGRGPVIREEALYRALKEGWIAGAAIDVWWEYPPSSNAPSRLGVHRLENVVATPHKAGWTRRARLRCLKFAAENVRRYLLGEEPLNVVNYDNPY